MRCSLESYPQLALWLAGGSRTWTDLRISETELQHLCDAEDLAPLCVHVLARSAQTAGWPGSLVEDLTARVRGQTVAEMVRQLEIGAVLSALAQSGVTPILMKGTAVAYTVYDSPALRPREDTDVLIAEADSNTTRKVLASRGYTATPQCHDLFCQFEMQRTDQFGVTHAFDIHWEISTQPVFRAVMTHRDALARAQPVAPLGPDALALGRLDALLLACVHPVMHHRGEPRAVWLYDMHLLARTLSTEEVEAFIAQARQAAVASVCARQLRRARTMFGTALPDRLVERLEEASDEPSAQYLASQRTWRHELMSSVRALPSLASRLQLLRGVLAPPSDYMLAAYGLRGKALGVWLLPALYVHRNLRGAWKVLAGKK